jgi:hypothetical protein
MYRFPLLHAPTDRAGGAIPTEGTPARHRLAGERAGKESPNFDGRRISWPPVPGSFRKQPGTTLWVDGGPVFLFHEINWRRRRDDATPRCRLYNVGRLSPGRVNGLHNDPARGPDRNDMGEVLNLSNEFPAPQPQHGQSPG